MNRRMGRAKGETHHHEEERWVSLRSTHPTRCGRRRSMAYAAVSGRQRAPRMSLFRTKSIEQSIADAVEPGHELKRSLSAWDLMILGVAVARSEEHTSELQSLMRISYAVFCLKKKKKSESH